nr:PREDICTED: uncharacterized protein LOC102367314 isoform X1 [Latimeria chalumnae]|eukprot:XP_014343450.1 PREDICTED: uncharacterized protein LOC102367314 isoform X1 [Latimeria chalumnae]
MVYCCAYNCTNKSGNGKSFFRFPNKEKKLKMHNLWLSKIRRKYFTATKYTCLCSDHFEEHCFVRSPSLMQSIGFKPKQLLLKTDAFPTIFNYGNNSKEKKIERGAFAKQQHIHVLKEILANFSSRKENLQEGLPNPSTVDCLGTKIAHELQANSTDFGTQTVKICCACQNQTLRCGTSCGCVAKPVLRDVAVCAGARGQDRALCCKEIDSEKDSDDCVLEMGNPSWEPMEEDTSTKDDDLADDPEVDFVRSQSALQGLQKLRLYAIY